MIIIKGSLKLETTGGDGNPLWIVQEIKILPYYQMVYVQIRICYGKLDA